MPDAAETAADQPPRIFRRFRTDEFWFTAVQLSGLRPVEESLTELVAGLIQLSRDWDCRIMTSLEPDGDAVETLHFTHIHCEMGTAWAIMTPFPERLERHLTPVVSEWLTDHGWADSQPNADEVINTDDPWRLDGFCSHCNEYMAYPQLTLDTCGGDVAEFARRLAASVRAVMCPHHDRWYLETRALANAGGRLHAHQPSWMRGTDYWPMRIADLLAPSATTPGVWRRGTQNGDAACREGFHQFHDGHCIDQDEPEELTVDDMLEKLDKLTKQYDTDGDEPDDNEQYWD